MMEDFEALDIYDMCDCTLCRILKRVTGRVNRETLSAMERLEPISHTHLDSSYPQPVGTD